MKLKLIISIATVVAAIGCAGSPSLSISHDEYDRLYMANKQFAIYDGNCDGFISDSDLSVIKNRGDQYRCRMLLKGYDGEEAISKQRYIDDYTTPKSQLDGERIGNIPYKIVDDERVMMDIYLPEEQYRPATGLMPVVLFFHGGGWRAGDKYTIHGENHRHVANMLLRRGIAVAAANYRFIVDGERYVPTVVSDAKDAQAFLCREGRRYGIDGERVVAWGGSAGGHLSLMCGFTDVDSFSGDESLKRWRRKPTGVVSWYGSGDFTLGSWDVAVERGHERFYRCFTDSKSEDVLYAKGLESSPLSHISSDDPHTILFGGDADVIVSINDARKMYAKLQECGVPSSKIEVRGAGHSWMGKGFEPNKEEIDRLTYNAVLTIFGMD